MAFFIREDIYKKSTRGCNFLGVRLVSATQTKHTKICNNFFCNTQYLSLPGSTDFTTTFGLIIASKSIQQLSFVNGHITNQTAFQSVLIHGNPIISFNSIKDPNAMISLQILIPTLWLVQTDESLNMNRVRSFNFYSRAAYIYLS